jgi:hypothetical protein
VAIAYISNTIALSNPCIRLKCCIPKDQSIIHGTFGDSIEDSTDFEEPKVSFGSSKSVESSIESPL